MLKNIGIAGGACGLVIGAALATSSVTGLMHDRDRWHALALRPTPPVASVPPAGAPSPGPGVSPRSDVQAPILRPGATVVVQPINRTSPKPAKHTPHPHPSPAPTAPHAAVCPRAQLLTVRVPLGVLPCTTLTVARVASIGGTGR